MNGVGEAVWLILWVSDKLVVEATDANKNGDDDKVVDGEDEGNAVFDEVTEING